MAAQEMEKLQDLMAREIKKHMLLTGRTEKEAFAEAVQWLAETYPKAALAYLSWLAAK